MAERLRKHGLSGRTVTIKVRLHDFTTLNRSTTLPSPTDSAATIARLARALLADLDTSGGVRLLGVGVSGLADWIQEDLFGDDRRRRRGPTSRPAPGGAEPTGAARWAPGHGRRARRDGPRAGSGARGAGVVTVRFETAGQPGRAGAVASPSTTPSSAAWQPDRE